MGMVLLVLALVVQQAVSTRRYQRRTVYPSGRTRWAVLAVAGGLSSTFLVSAFSAYAMFITMVNEVGWTSHLNWLFIVAMTAGALRFAFLADRPLRWARRVLQPSAEEVLRADSRPEVLLLRSFQDDSLEIRTRPTAERALAESVIRESNTRFEEHIAWCLWRLGPVVAVGQSGANLAPLGAVREYLAEDVWQSAVEERMDHSMVIAMIVGRSPALYWEIGEIRRKGLLSKTLFLFPPLDRKESEYRMAVLSSALNVDVFDLLPDGPRWPVALAFEASGKPRLFVTDGRDDVSYEIVIQRAGELMTKNAGVNLNGPSAHWTSVDQVDTRSLLVPFDSTKSFGQKRSWLKIAWDFLWPAIT